MRNQPWLQMEGETDEAYAAFCGFRDSGPGRSLDGAWRAHAGPSKAPRAPGSWKRYRKHHDWLSRAQAFDDRNDAVLDGARVEALGAHASEWATRQVEARDADWEIGAQLRRVVKASLERLEDEMLAAGYKVDQQALARLAELSSKLQRLGADMPADTPGAGAAAPKDLTSMSSAELQEFIREASGATTH